MVKIISYNKHKKLMRGKHHKLIAEIMIMQRDMAYKFIENHGLKKKFDKWFLKKLIHEPHNKSTRGKK